MDTTMPAPTAKQVADAEAAALVAQDLSAADAVAVRFRDSIAPYREAIQSLADGPDDDRYALTGRVSDAMRGLAPFGDLLDSAEASAAAMLLLRYRRECEERSRYHKRQVADLERDVLVAERVLEPALRRYAEANPPKKGKTISFSEAPAKLAWRATKGAVRTTNRDKAVASIEAAIGSLEAYDAGVLKLRADVSRTGVRELLEKRPELADKLDGVVVDPPEERFYVRSA